MTLAHLAMDVARSRGRRWPQPAHPYRNDYARDRDRIIHARAFRRLEAKTQVFTTRYSDHFRNRLTHTLEVAQIARTVAGALELNTDLIEALALVHDIGHPPFGHAGEAQLDRLLRPLRDRFDHNLHALRIVEQFEQRYLDFPGLNLTFEVREGIVKHSRDYAAAEFPELAEYDLDRQPPLEAQLMDAVDQIAYDTADLDDGFESRLLDLDMVREELPFFGEVYAEVERSHPARPPSAEAKRSDSAHPRPAGHRPDRSTPGHGSLQAARRPSTISGAPRGGLPDSVLQRPRESASIKSFLYRRLYDNPQIVEERDRSVEALEAAFPALPGSPGRHAPVLCSAGRARAAPPGGLRLHCGHDR